MEQGRTEERRCEVVDCKNVATKWGFCHSHLVTARRYGIHPASLALIFETGCLVCGSHEQLRIDHDHACCFTTPACGNCVRGALCNSCNVVVGHIDRRLEKYTAAVAYANQNPRMELAPYPSDMPSDSIRRRGTSKASPQGTRARFEQLNTKRTLTPEQYEELKALSLIFVAD